MLFTTRCCFVLCVVAASAPLDAQLGHRGNVAPKPTPEIQKLYDELGGDWDTKEVRQKTRFFPQGGERTGHSHVGLGTGGATLVLDGESDGSAGPLSYHIVIWWDPKARIYGYFTCFKDQTSGCEIRGSAHWEGNVFVNDYEETVEGKSWKFKDIFKDITPSSHTLLFEWIKDDSSTEPVIISTSVRHPKKTSR